MGMGLQTVCSMLVFPFLFFDVLPTDQAGQPAEAEAWLRQMKSKGSSPCKINF